jgi:hypothetical protein
MADTVEVTELVPGERWDETIIQPETDEILVTKTRLSNGRVEDSYKELEEYDAETTVTHQEPDEEVTHLKYVDRTELQTKIEREYQTVPGETWEETRSLGTSLSHSGIRYLDGSSGYLGIPAVSDVDSPLRHAGPPFHRAAAPGGFRQYPKARVGGLGGVGGGGGQYPKARVGGLGGVGGGGGGGFRQYPKLRAASPTSRFVGGSPVYSPLRSPVYSPSRKPVYSPSHTYVDRRPSPAKRALDYSPRRVAGSPRRVRATSPSLHLSPVARSYRGSPHASLRERESSWAI